ncbi:DUF3006 family protein [Halorubrum sp. Ea8]|uniref:DUF3006 family protein n=1 Tax=Halorubrum sp. Ea8 TaxID=1383841 RepID=UPI000B99567F|nr:DUF3006 family protein [Halorubrum sp. Ea8]OYR45659.1 hypothetical protein DJ74_15930 [Halorubrum sp. Ea8]
MTEIDLADGTYTAVVDAVEDGFATLFFERDGDEVGNVVLGVDRLPDDGRHADAILDVEVEDGSIATATYEPERTSSRSEAAQDRFDRLSSRPPKDGRE